MVNYHMPVTVVYRDYVPPAGDHLSCYGMILRAQRYVNKIKIKNHKMPAHLISIV